MTDPFVATFQTHTGAMEFCEKLKALGDQEAYLAPVPRSLSVSCGTGVFFHLPFQRDTMYNEDLEAVYRITPEGYVRIKEGGES